MTPPVCGSAQRLVHLQERTFDVSRVPRPHPLRVTPPPPEILEVWEAVVGPDARDDLDEVAPFDPPRRRLSGWQLREAACAMSALGDSDVHIGWWLGLHPTTVATYVRRGGGNPSMLDRRPDRLGIFIALLGGRIRLKDADREKAVELLARRGLTYVQIADRLMIDNHHSLARDAMRHGVHVVPGDAWRCEVIAFQRKYLPEVKREESLAA